MDKIRLTEQDLHMLVEDAVKNYLNEVSWGGVNNAWQGIKKGNFNVGQTYNAGKFASQFNKYSQQAQNALAQMINISKQTKNKSIATELGNINKMIGKTAKGFTNMATANRTLSQLNTQVKDPWDAATQKQNKMNRERNAQINQLNQQVSDLQGQYNDLQNQHTGLQGQYTDLQKRYDVKNAGYDVLSNQYNTLKSKMAQPFNTMTDANNAYWTPSQGYFDNQPDYSGQYGYESSPFAQGQAAPAQNAGAGTLKPTNTGKAVSAGKKAATPRKPAAKKPVAKKTNRKVATQQELFPQTGTQG
jgi:DNA-binding ferritin-like protein